MVPINILLAFDVSLHVIFMASFVEYLLQAIQCNSVCSGNPPKTEVLLIRFGMILGCWLEFYHLATIKFISGRALTCDSVRSLCLHNAASLGNEAVSTMT